MPLIRTPNIPDPDGFYEELIDSQRALDDAQAEAMNARLVLILANHIGDREVLREALAAALAGNTLPAAAAGRGARRDLTGSSDPVTIRPRIHRAAAPPPARENGLG